MEKRGKLQSVKKLQNSLCVQVCFEVSSPWEGQRLLEALTALTGYQITISPRLTVLKEIVSDEEAYLC